MAKRRPPGFDFASAVQAAGFTPRESDVGELLALDARAVGDDDDALGKLTLRALLRVPAATAEAVVGALEGEQDEARRARLVEVLGRAVEQLAEVQADVEGAPAPDPSTSTEDDPLSRFTDLLFSLLEDPLPRARRAAVRALERRGAGNLEAALLEAWAREDDDANRRALIEALGHTGGEAAQTMIKALPADDPALSRVRERALLALERDRVRGAESAIDIDAVPAQPIRVLLRTRRGLEQLLAAELAALPAFVAARPPGSLPELAAHVTGPGHVAATLASPLRTLLGSRIWESLGFPLTRQRVTEPDGEAGALAAALTSPEAERVLTTFTRGALRYRIGWTGGGKRRAEVYGAAALISARRPALVNDPRAATWNAAARDYAGWLEVVLEPWRLPDPRFAYRLATVKAASHPTVAAALVRLAGPLRADDVVWDPFTGSGLELCERGLAGPFAHLHGSDLDPGALSAARQNLDAALPGAAITLTEADARTHAPPGVTLIISNPPLGWRVAPDQGLAPLYDAFVAHAARVLQPGGRLVWISALPEVTRAAAARAGLREMHRSPIEMGCLRTELEVYHKP